MTMTVLCFKALCIAALRQATARVPSDKCVHGRATLSQVLLRVWPRPLSPSRRFSAACRWALGRRTTAVSSVGSGKSPTSCSQLRFTEVRLAQNRPFLSPHLTQAFLYEPYLGPVLSPAPQRCLISSGSSRRQPHESLPLLTLSPTIMLAQDGLAFWNKHPHPNSVPITAVLRRTGTRMASALLRTITTVFYCAAGFHFLQLPRLDGVGDDFRCLCLTFFVSGFS